MQIILLWKSRNRNKTSLPASKLPSHELEKDMKQKEVLMELKGFARKLEFCLSCQQATHTRFSCSLLTKFGHVEDEKNENLCNELVEELSNRQSVRELDQDPDPSKILLLSLPSKVHEIILHNRYLS